uniref:Uncharacterized protein n=1 Tax=Rhizophora mucronata TaxID=61149 RepID=A0A2P2INB7_RHIMU
MKDGSLSVRENDSPSNYSIALWSIFYIILFVNRWVCANILVCCNLSRSCGNVNI